jgi:ferritin
MLPPVVQDALNQQINCELIASYNYLAMSAYCQHLQFHGFAQWLEAQSQEEHTHAMKIYNFMIARDCQVRLLEIPTPQAEFSSLLNVFEVALEQEYSVSKSIDALYELAFKEKAFAALVELQWFITEQVEEEQTFREIVTKIKLLQDDPAAMLDLDREMGSRAGGGEAAAEA